MLCQELGPFWVSYRSYSDTGSVATSQKQIEKYIFLRRGTHYLFHLCVADNLLKKRF